MKKAILCIGIFVFILIIIDIGFASNDFNIKACKQTCKEIQKETSDACKTGYLSCKEVCIDSTCKKNCIKEYSLCRKNSVENYRNCQKQCIPSKLPLTCLNGTYNLGDKFPQGCEICECKEKGKVVCKRDAFCNRNTSITVEACTNGGGLYYEFCNGPYFDIVCFSQKFCFCNGIQSYTCPSQYECMTDFIAPNKRVHTIPGWKDLLGNPLGNIGICVQNS